MVSVAVGVFFYYTIWVLILVSERRIANWKWHLMGLLVFFEYMCLLIAMVCDSLLWMRNRESRTFSRLASTPF